ncbi:acyl-CoA dehydrogenase family protein [Gordonia sp. NPDC127522]|uniref:acyl-CoA dehydrogenase family protein n=1 Tax=Gordonia sp. NPDC127522 TaxID=3345390 RepID=UPI003635FE96
MPWSTVRQAGWTGLELPGDAGECATFREVAVLLFEVGRACAGSPFLAVASISVAFAQLGVPGDERDRLTGAIEAAESVHVTAVAADSLEPHTAFDLVHSNGRWSVHGTESSVLDAMSADRLLLPARYPDGRPAIAVIDADSSGISITEQPLVDETRTMGRVDAAGAVPDAVIPMLSEDSNPLSHIADRATLALAWDSLGLSEAMLEATVAYCAAREQFGRPIASFQAVKHACADMFVQISLARGLVDEATELVSDRLPGASRAVSMAKVSASVTGVQVAGKAVQLHGAYGYSWESGLHRYLKRAILNRSLFGSLSAHRRRVAEAYGV